MELAVVKSGKEGKDEKETEEVQFAVLVDVETHGSIFLRAYITKSPPSQADMEYYYRILCGFEDAVVTVKRSFVPECLKDSQFMIYDKVPNTFPVYNYALKSADVRPRENFKLYYEHMVALTNLRDEMRREKPREDLKESGLPTNIIDTKLTWVKELLTTLTEATESDFTDVDAAAWILVPTAAEGRLKYGARILRDPEIFRAWSSRLGTTNYPDLILSKTLNCNEWPGDPTHNKELMAKCLEWYYAIMKLEQTQMLTPWLPNAASELNRLFHGFLGVGSCLPPRPLVDAHAGRLACMRCLTDYSVTADIDHLPVKRMDPKNVEALLRAAPSLGTKDTPPNPTERDERAALSVCKWLGTFVFTRSTHRLDSEPLSAAVLHGFATITLTELGFHPNTVYTWGSLQKITEYWETQGFGCLPDFVPPFESWNLLYKLLIRSRATESRVDTFVKTIQLQNAKAVDESGRDALYRGWVECYISFNFEFIEHAYESTLDVFERFALFMCHYTCIPKGILIPKYTKKYFQQVQNITYGRQNHGTYYYGCKFRAPEVILPDCDGLARNMAVPPAMPPEPPFASAEEEEQQEQQEQQEQEVKKAKSPELPERPHPLQMKNDITFQEIKAIGRPSKKAVSRNDRKIGGSGKRSKKPILPPAPVFSGRGLEPQEEEKPENPEGLEKPENPEGLEKPENEEKSAGLEKDEKLTPTNTFVEENSVTALTENTGRIVGSSESTTIHLGFI